MKKIAQLTLFASLISTATSYCWEWSKADLIAQYQNWLEDRAYQRNYIKPVTKIINEEARKKIAETDMKIDQLSNIDTSDFFDHSGRVHSIVYLDKNKKEILHKYYEKKELQRTRDAFSALAADPNAFLENDDRYFQETREMGAIMETNRDKIDSLLQQFRKKYPSNERPILTIARDKFKKQQLIKENISNILTSAERYKELLSQVE